MQIDVDRLMQGELGQWLNDQSAMREDARRTAWDRALKAGGAIVLLIAVLWFDNSFGTTASVIMTLIACLIAGIWVYMPIATATKAIKVGINSAIARSLGIEYSHDVDTGPEFEAAKTYALLPSYHRSEFEDRWFGTLEGHRFHLYEAHLEQQRGSGKDKRWVTVFRGAIIDMNFGRSFHSTTLLQRAGEHRKWFGLGGRKDSVKFKGHRLDLVDQVHPAFEDSFDVYSDDQVEARVLVHPSYVEHLVALEKAFKGEAVRAVFHRGNVVIAVESGNLFESGSINSDGDRQRVEEAAGQFSSLARLALAINQNDRGLTLGKAAPENFNEVKSYSALRGGFGRKRR